MNRIPIELVGSLPASLAAAFPAERLPEPGRLLLAGLGLLCFARLLGAMLRDRVRARVTGELLRP